MVLIFVLGKLILKLTKFNLDTEKCHSKIWLKEIKLSTSYFRKKLIKVLLSELYNQVKIIENYKITRKELKSKELIFLYNHPRINKIMDDNGKRSSNPFKSQEPEPYKKYHFKFR